nr:carbohydrate-binding domain-containing protein [uncultured Rhodopila sp.]
MATPDTGINADLNGAIPFDAESQWNLPVENAPILWDSAQIMASINTAVGLHPDFGSGTYDGITIGIPYVVVPADQPLVPFINDLYTTESDPGPFPIPDNPPIQGEGATGYNDNHLIVLQLDANGNLAEEYDFFQISQNTDGVWQGYAIEFNLTGGDDQIPMGWTSANAAGLPEFPGLITYDEVQEAIAEGGVNGHLDHALAFTLASWDIGSEIFGAAEHATQGGGAAGFGMRFVLNPDFQIDQSLPIEDIVILNTLKIYGMILIDNGSNFFLAGAPDPRWNNADLNLLQTAVTGSDFEIVDTTGLVPPPAITVGSGADSLVLQVSENAYQGNAQFTVSVNGNPVGGVQTILALNSGNQTQTFTFLGDWGSTQNSVTISFVNPLSDANGSRTMLPQSISYDGTGYSSNDAALSATGSVSFIVGDVPAVGSGPDLLVLNIDETAYQGDAQFTISVDGTQVGGVQAATMQNDGEAEQFDVFGNWGGGQHTVVVDFVNGLSDAAGSRNLFIWGMNYDGTDYANNVSNLYGGGLAAFLIGPATPIGTGSDSLVLHVCEAAYQGDAQFTVSVDGTQIGGVETATLLGAIEDFTFLGNWGSGQHSVTVNFVNGLSDAGGSRNLFVEGMSYDGTAYVNNDSNLYGGGNASFLVGTALPIGFGPDSLVLRVSENPYKGNVQFTVSVDGIQIGGVETIVALNAGGDTQAFTFLGDWGTTQHTVTISFVNPLSDANGSRAMLLQGVTYDGTNSTANAAALASSGSTSLTIGDIPTIGSGSDLLVLHVYETAYQGDAQFTVSVDGTQIGGIETATVQGGGRTEAFDVLGNWGSGQHTILVNFINGLSDAGGSRNLFIWGMNYDGTDYANDVSNLYGGGAAAFLIGPATPIGSGSDSLVLHVCEAAYQGDAQFTVSVDGTQIGGVETATLLGATEDFTFLGNWGSGQHSVTVNFINGLSDAAGSRNLYVEGISYDGTQYTNTAANLYGGGAASFLVGTSSAIGSGSDSLVLHVCEAAYQGDAQFTVSVDGTQIGGVETATLPGTVQDFTFLGNWGSGQHTIVVNFTNGLSDAGGSRNLYVEGMSYDGTAYSNNVSNLYGGGAAAFLIGPATPIGTGSDSLVLHVCEAAYQGNAQFTVSVDGTQVGGIETATLLGGNEDFTFLGNWGSGQHAVIVNFTNGLSDAGGSRNLYVEGMSYDGTAYNNNAANLYGGGSGSFLVGTSTAQPAASETIQVTPANLAAGGSASSLSFLSADTTGSAVPAASPDPLSVSTDALSAAAGMIGASSQIVAAGFVLPDPAVGAASYAVLPSDTIGSGAGSLAAMTTAALINAAATSYQQTS